jgi:predicted unusual protein kinase regulating ubiquinone biosynthesis (AarF/ABC1/UbiB family)
MQYPGIEGALKHDLKALGLLALPLTGKHRGFHLKEYRETLSQSLLTEIDYREELSALERFQEYRKSEPAVISPTPYRELSTERLLTMSWVPGFPIESTRRWDFSERLFIARTLTRLFLKEWLLWGEIHADPHSGNYRFQRSSNGIQVGLLDFGCVKRLSPNESSALRSLLEWGNIRTQNLLEMYTQLGFNHDLLEPIEKKLPQITELILEPILSKRPFLVSEWQISKRMSAILGEDRWNFRIAGPPSLIFFIRAFSGVMQQLEFLSVPTNWSVELDRILASEPAQTLNRAGSTTERSTTESPGDAQRASQLKIAVLENGLPKVQLSFKPHLVTQLHLLMDSELFAKLESRGIEVDEVAKTAVESGFKKQELFSLSEDSKDFRVWLE